MTRKKTGSTGASGYEYGCAVERGRAGSAAHQYVDTDHAGSPALTQADDGGVVVGGVGKRVSGGFTLKEFKRQLNAAVRRRGLQLRGAKTK